MIDKVVEYLPTKTSHKKLNDLEAEFIERLKKESIYARNDFQAKNFFNSKDAPITRNIVEYNLEFYISTQLIIERYHDIPLSYLFFITNDNGCIIALFGEKAILDKFQDIKFDQGTFLAIEYAGINAVSLATRLHQPVIVQGSEHNFNLMTNYISLCNPIQKENNIIGYLGLLAPIDSEIDSSQLISKNAQQIEHYLHTRHDEERKQYANALFDIYNLTLREKKIAYDFSLGLTSETIADIKNLSTDSVATTIKRVYSKMNINNKDDLIMLIDRI